MTIVLLQPDGVPITAQAERQGSAALYGGGSGRQLGGRSGFRVGTPADTLTATSTTWTLKPCAAQIDPGASTHQGMYGWASDANITGSVTASDATYARKDIVFIQVNDSTAGDGSGEVAALPGYLAGTPSTTPTAPTLPARSFLVGTIDVPKTGAGSPTVTLNPARFVAAGGILPATLEERDALSAYDGLTVRRMDVPGRPLETYDATTPAWVRTAASADTGWLDAPLINDFQPLTTGGWGGAKYAARNGWVIIALAMNRTPAWSGGVLPAAVIPAAYRPSIRVKGVDGWINPNGEVIPTSSGPGQVSVWITYPLV